MTLGEKQKYHVTRAREKQKYHVTLACEKINILQTKSQSHCLEEKQNNIVVVNEMQYVQTGKNKIHALTGS